MVAINEDEIHWFVLRDLKRANAKLPAYLQLTEGGFEVFTPMQQRIVTRNCKRIREEVPVVRDLLFVHTTARQLNPVIARTNTLQYRFVKGAPHLTPMTVPTAEMERFIKATTESKSAIYLTPEEITPDMIGREIRIIDGPLQGYTGRLLKVSGSRKRRLLVSLQDHLVAAVEIENDFLEFL